MSCIFAVIGAILLIWFILPLFSGIINIGNITGIAVSGAIIITAVKHRDILRIIGSLWENSFGRVIVTVVFGAVMICIITAAVLTVLMIGAIAERPDGSEGTVIVLGCRVKESGPSLMLTKRINAAYEYLSENPRAVCIASGGKGADEPMTEAECIGNELIKRGIDESRIYIENRSESTSENFAFSAFVSEQNGFEKKAVVATSEFHLFRAKLLAEKQGFKVSGVSSSTAWYLLPTYWVREWFCILHEIIRS